MRVARAKRPSDVTGFQGRGSDIKKDNGTVRDSRVSVRQQPTERAATHGKAEELTAEGDARKGGAGVLVDVVAQVTQDSRGVAAQGKDGVTDVGCRFARQAGQLASRAQTGLGVRVHGGHGAARRPHAMWQEGV